MKLSKALLLLTACTLVACSTSKTTSSNVVSSSSEAETSSVTSSTSEVTSTSVSTTTTESTTSLPTSTSQSTTSELEPPVGVTKKTVSFYNGGFTSSSLNQEASRNQFVTWFNNGDDVLESIGYQGYAQLNYIGNTSDSWRYSTLILGSGNSEGKITFNFKVDIISIKVTVQAYSKYIAYNDSYSTDTDSIFILDNDEHDLSVEDNHQGDTEKETIEKAYMEGTKVISIANKEAGNRVFVHSLELTYWG